MPDISVKDQIKKMVELQKIDGDIYNFKKELKEKPAAIELLKQEFESKKAHLNALEEKVKDIQVKRKEHELELQTKEEEISKANVKLSELKTNKEYTAMITEIENIKADKSLIEETILKSYDEVDGVNAEIDQEKSRVGEEEKKYLSEKSKTEGEVKEIEDKIKVLETQRQQLVPEMDPTTLSLYEKILNHKEGLAIVPVDGNTCGGCFMNVTAQQINAIKMGENIVACEICTRILYIEEDL